MRTLVGAERVSAMQIGLESNALTGSTAFNGRKILDGDSKRLSKGFHSGGTTEIETLRPVGILR